VNDIDSLDLPSRWLKVIILHNTPPGSNEYPWFATKVILPLLILLNLLVFVKAQHLLYQIISLAKNKKSVQTNWGRTHFLSVVPPQLG
jgi:hypothetical protein